MTGRADKWDGGAAYEAYVGRWSRPVAREFLAWIGAGPGRWLDVGSGTGALSGTILEAVPGAEVVGVDASAAFVEHARAQVPAARFEVADARELPFGDGEFDGAVSGLVLNFVPDPGAAAGEMARVVRPGGTVAAYVWDYAEGMELMRRFWDAAVALDPAVAEIDESQRFGIARPEPLRSLFTDAGLRGVEVRAIEIPTTFADFDDYWTPFLGGQGPAPGYTVSLPEDRRAALRERLRASLEAAPDGRIELTARAWAVRGRRA